MQVQQKRTESLDVVAQIGGVAADDARRGGTAVHVDSLAREALVGLLMRFAKEGGAPRADLSLSLIHI